MASELPKLLRELASSTQTLNELTDEASSVISNLEDILSSLNLGVETWVAVDTGKAGRPLALGYRRQGTSRRYRLVVRDQSNEFFWEQLSRDGKIQVLAAVPSLVRQLLQQVQEKVQRVKGALAEISTLLPDSKGGTGNAKI